MDPIFLFSSAELGPQQGYEREGGDEGGSHDSGVAAPIAAAHQSLFGPVSSLGKQCFPGSVGNLFPIQWRLYNWLCWPTSGAQADRNWGLGLRGKIVVPESGQELWGRLLPGWPRMVTKARQPVDDWMETTNLLHVLESIFLSFPVSSSSPLLLPVQIPELNANTPPYLLIPCSPFSALCFLFLLKPVPSFSPFPPFPIFVPSY